MPGRKKKSTAAAAVPTDGDAEMLDAPIDGPATATAENGDDADVMQDEAPEVQDPTKPMIDSAAERDLRQRLRVLPGDSPTAASFEFLNEDHTLGNALRYVIMKNPDVEFCGYSIPHPSDPKMNIRIQTYDDVNVFDVLEKGLADLADLCDVMLDKFEVARDEFAAKGPDAVAVDND